MIRQEILSNLKHLPSISQSVIRLSVLLRDENASATHFEEAIRLDPSLTANLLKVANSAFFGREREVTGVKQAIVIMGTKRVYEAAVAASLTQLIPSHLAGYGIEAASFWSHSAAVAVMSEHLAQTLNMKTPDMVMTSGLLHDIGKIAISVYLAKNISAVTRSLQNPEHSFIDAEQEALGVDHAEIGAELAKSWNFPETIIHSIRYHHSPNELPNQQDQHAVDLVHAANSMAHLFGYGADVGELKRRVEPDVSERLGLSTQDLEATISRALSDIQDMISLFN